MDVSPIDIVIFAPLAPILGVLLFWFIQLLFIESEKYLLEKIRPKHEPLCRFTNFLGILFQNICHALGYTVTKSGISDFQINIHYGTVKPKKEKKGIFEWISNGFLFLGPFFIPAFLLLLCLLILMSSGFDTTTPVDYISQKYSFAGQMITFGSSLYIFSNNFFNFLINIDLLHPGHFGFLIFMIFLGMGIRPSYIGEKKRKKVDMIYDLRNIYSLIVHHPLYIILLFTTAYLFFYISFWLNQIWYASLFSVLGWLSIISITAIIISNLILILIKKTDEIEGNKRIFPFLVTPMSYILIRALFFYFPADFVYSGSLLFMIFSTFLVTFLLLDNRTNKFKTKINIKLFNRNKGE